MEFKITYLDENSNKLSTRGVYKSKEEVISLFKIKSYKIISIETIDDNIKANTKGKPIKAKLLSEFLKQFGILLSAGIDIITIINILQKQEKNKELKAALDSINKNLELGFTLSECFMNTDAFPKILSDVIKAGELSSNLHESIILLSEYYDEDIKLKQNIKNSLYYPMILLAVTFIVVILITTFVLPSFATVYSMYDNANLPRLTQLLLSVAAFMGENYIYILIGLIVIITLLNVLLSNSTFRKKIDKKVLNLPILGKYISNIEIQRFSGILSITVGSGMDLINSIEVSSESINNLHLKSKIKSILPRIISGNSLYNSFSNINELPDIFLNLLNIGENSSSLYKTMTMAYDYFKNLNESENKKISALIEPIVILFVSLIVGTVVLAIALPTFSIVNII